MFSASSNQSVVRDRADYEEVYSSGHKDQESLGEERSPSASSSSSTNEDMEMAELEDISEDGEDQPLRFVIGADGLREFIMLQSGQCINSHPSSRRNTSAHLGPFFKFQTTFQSVYPTFQRNVIMRG